MCDPVILGKVQDIFRDVLDDDEIVLSETSCADDIDEWDSLANIQLVVALEKAFSVKFTSGEIVSWKNVGEMVNCISQKS